MTPLVEGIDAEEFHPDGSGPAGLAACRYYVYVLIDPRTNAPFYVGRTSNPYERLNKHLESANDDSKGPRLLKQTILKLLDAGVTPEMKVVEECQDREAWWVQHLGKDYELCNVRLTGHQEPIPPRIVQSAGHIKL